MAYYFDPTNADDLKLLNSDVRSDSELENISNPTEDDVRQMYTVYDESSEQYEVKLRGYTSDPDDAAAAFKKAYKQTIADVISYRLLNYSNTKGVKRDRRGQREQEYFEGYRPEELPQRLFCRLSLYDTKTPVFGI